MKKSGFTLVELLAVIVILAVILAIAIPSVSSIIETSKANAYVDNEQMMLKAVKDYIVVNGSGLPVNIGDTSEIGLSTLQTNNYISAIQDPNDKSKSCNGYVLVNKTSTTDYSYSPFLNCNNGAGSKASDGLVAYYPFDDFQEPTTNLLSTSAQIFQGWSNYQSSTINTIVNQVVPEWGTINATRLQISGGTSVIKYLKSVGVSANGSPYAFSIYIKNIGTVDVGINDNLNNTVYVSPGNVQRVAINDVGNGTSNIQLSIKARNVGDSLDFLAYEPQIETKDHVTPFITDSRTGTVNDYSGNGSSAALQLTSTPQWISSAKVGTGAYNFDGSSSVINLPSNLSTVLNNSSFTISAWVKSSGLVNGSSASGIISLGYGLVLRINSTSQLECLIDDGVSGTFVSTTGANLFDNQFHYVVLTYDRTNARLYIDGVEKQKQAVAWNNRFNNSGTIGTDVNDSANRRFKGIIDDITIYNRTLSATDINFIYQSEK